MVGNSRAVYRSSEKVCEVTSKSKRGKVVCKVAVYVGSCGSTGVNLALYIVEGLAPSKVASVEVLCIYAGLCLSCGVTVLYKLVNGVGNGLILAGIISLKTGGKLALVVILVELNNDFIATACLAAGGCAGISGITTTGRTTRSEQHNYSKHSYEKAQNFEFHFLFSF